MDRSETQPGVDIVQRMKTPLLSTQDLKIGYTNGKSSHKVVASGLNLQLIEGEFVCLVGPNGAGKSTLLRTLTGLLPALEGDVLLDGKKLEQYTRKELANEISVVLTSPIEVGAMTVTELVAMGRFPFTGLFDRMSAKDWEIVHQSLELVGLKDFEKRMIHKLSDGERQKVMIARALAQEPRILVLDEPTAYLDLPGRVSIMNLMHELVVMHGKTVLTSTHDLDLAMRSADRFWLMSQQGEILQGAPEDLVLSGDFQRIFARDRISFDLMNGHFSVTGNSAGEVCLNGGGEVRVWTERALQRVGYSVNEDRDTCTGLRIDIAPDQSGYLWVLEEEGGTRQFGDLESLVKHLRALSFREN
ncbi:MAG: ABC transporter ATP-binding protein [Chloroflexi bacterium]|jgi:iron complex transport system ATP-binding protein|nr:ABC transporter ATP-binding protein [Chloroflexota bacterium]